MLLNKQKEKDSTKVFDSMTNVFCILLFILTVLLSQLWLNPQQHVSDKTGIIFAIYVLLIIILFLSFIQFPEHYTPCELIVYSYFHLFLGVLSMCTKVSHELSYISYFSVGMLSNTEKIGISSMGTLSERLTIMRTVSASVRQQEDTYSAANMAAIF